ncbi:hypothetical protein [Spiroplasma endosymbiont of Othius punctulatus]|uniref:hypothetical protein n=1 Tax=Spiroplasma endosymbiont of Othius punctulatus TaxID=3066289 RepID=UPI0030D4AD25
MQEQQRDILKQNIANFIKSDLKDESKENLKHKILGWGSLAVAAIMIVGSITFAFNTDSQVGIVVSFTVGLVVALGLLYFGISQVAKSKLTTKENTLKVREQLQKYFEEYLNSLNPEIKIDRIEFKKLAALGITLDISGQKFLCDTTTVIRKETRRDFLAINSNRRNRRRTYYYYDTTLNVSSSIKSVGLTGTIEIKKGNTPEGKLNKFASESIEFNKKFDINASKEDGFNFFTPKKIELFITNAEEINENAYQVREGELSFGKSWSVIKNNRRAKEIASKDIDRLSSNDNKMLNQIMLYIESSMVKPLKYLELVSKMS